jgi:hypothetical protein
MDAKPGEFCSNGPWDERWTCPNCYHDHSRQVTTCENCSASIRCTWETQRVAVCTIADSDDS